MWQVSERSLLAIKERTSRNASGRTLLGQCKDERKRTLANAPHVTA